MHAHPKRSSSTVHFKSKATSSAGLIRSILMTLLVGYAIGLFLIWSSSAFAARVVKTKGKKVLVNLEGGSAQQGDVFYVVSSSGKKVGILKIMKVKGEQAIAVLGKGQATPGYTLMARTPYANTKDAPSQDESPASDRKSVV